MKKSIMATAAALFITIFISTFSLAASGSQEASHNMKGDDKNMSHEMDSSKNMSQGSQGGNVVHSSMVGEYHFNYELFDMRENMKGMENMPEMKATHHLMLTIKSNEGHMADNMQVGYLIENPDKTTQKVMTMGMGEGFGGDVNFSEKGVYTIKVKVAAGDENLMDTFKYEMK